MRFYLIHLISQGHCVGSWHDNFVLKQTKLWKKLTEENWMPLDGGMFLGDGAYEGHHRQFQTIHISQYVSFPYFSNHSFDGTYTSTFGLSLFKDYYFLVECHTQYYFILQLEQLQKHDQFF